MARMALAWISLRLELLDQVGLGFFGRLAGTDSRDNFIDVIEGDLETF